MRTLYSYSAISYSKLAIRHLIALTAPSVYFVQGLANARLKISVSIANFGLNFFYPHLSFFTFKSWDECSAPLHIAQKLSYGHWPWRNSVNKTPPFLHFLIAKGGTKTIVHLPITEGVSFRSLVRRIYNSKLWKRFNPSAR